jgi:hypothetical protein
MNTDPDTNTDTPVDAASRSDLDADRRPEPAADRPCDHPSIELCSVLVEYDEMPDRRTVYPDGLGGVERMSTWLTADATAFVDLGANR